MISLKTSIKEIKKVLKDLEAEGIITYEIGYRGGYYGISYDDFCRYIYDLEAEESRVYFPEKIGVYCNYLGGGVRGAIVKGGHSKEVSRKIARFLDKFYDACIERYEEIENEMELNDNSWEAKATAIARRNGIISAY